ncbi:MAG: glucose 1-dehydrogenase [Calditrichia bacterium]
MVTSSKRTAIITGATSGIGLETARLFSQTGYQLAITGRNETRLENLAREIGNNVLALAGDIGNISFRRELVEKTIDRFGSLDVLVNSAGIIQSDTVENVKLESYENMMNVNVTALIDLIQQSVPHLEKTKGNILNVSSVAGTRCFPGIMSYCVSKAAVDQLTRCAAMELAPKKIRVNAVNPGVVETMLHRNSGMDDNRYAEFLEHSKATHPIGRAGQANEVADLIAFLCSENAGWITGGTYAIDGGRALTCAR